MNYRQAIEVLKVRKEYIAEINIDALEAYNLAIEALEKQVFFENKIDIISDWFINNKDCLLDLAGKIVRDKFKKNSENEYIDEVDLYFIVEEVVDEIHKGILNVLSTFKDD